MRLGLLPRMVRGVFLTTDHTEYTEEQPCFPMLLSFIFNPQRHPGTEKKIISLSFPLFLSVSSVYSVVKN